MSLNNACSVIILKIIYRVLHKNTTGHIDWWYLLYISHFFKNALPAAISFPILVIFWTKRTFLDYEKLLQCP